MTMNPEEVIAQVHMVMRNLLERSAMSELLHNVLGVWAAP